MGVQPAHVSTTGNAYKINYELIREIFKGVKTCTNLCTNSFFLTFIALDCTELHWMHHTHGRYLMESKKNRGKIDLKLYNMPITVNYSLQVYRLLRSHLAPPMCTNLCTNLCCMQHFNVIQS